VAQLMAVRSDDVQPAPLRPLGVGRSFLDATRVAGSNTAIWTDIYLANRDALMVAIDDLTDRLAVIRKALVEADAGVLKEWNESARADRETLLRLDS
ncbi:MAG TPA: prephenate dehydrogenase dimerization domain-containing protein, partial [Solirubrobacteraceae bacterium]|nr:prephenate dehydrogenase dimerization domain-containing protein [Solirubrobacteraceae bacterium]